MKKHVKVILAVVLAVACAAGGAFYLAMPLPVEALELQRETAVVTFTEQGVYGYASTFQVYPLISGEVLEVKVKEGEIVAAGDVIAVISADDYLYQIAQLRGSINGYQAQIENLALLEQQEKDALAGTLGDLSGQLAALEAQMNNQGSTNKIYEEQLVLQQELVRLARKSMEDAEDEYKDARDEYHDGQLGYSGYAAARQAMTTARANYTAAQVTLEQIRGGTVNEGVLEGQRQSIQAQIAAANSRMGKSYTGAMSRYYSAQIQSTNAMIAQLESKMGQAAIASPVPGVISELPVKDANVISQAAPVAVVGGQALVEAYVPVREIGHIKTGDVAELIFEKRLETEYMQAVVEVIEQKAQVRQTALGVEERKVRVLLRPQKEGCMIGGEMDVRFTIYSRENAIIAPKTAVFESEGMDCVWLLENSCLEIRQVKKTVETKEGFVIEEGLQEGDIIVIDAANESLAPGKKAKTS